MDSAYSETKVEERYAHFEGPQQAYCCRPAGDLDLRTDNSPCVLWVVRGEGSPLLIRQAVVRKTMSSDSQGITKTTLRCVYALCR
jgi:hypothetical protein